MKIRIGIDPGIDSFVVIFKDNQPTFIRNPLMGKELDLLALNDLILAEIEGCEDVYAVIEDVHAIFGSSAGNTWSFAQTCAFVESILILNKIPYTKVAPKKWQKEMHNGVPAQTKIEKGKTKVDTKAMSLIAATRIYPNLDFRVSERGKKPDHNKVDALLIAEYCRRNF